MGKIKKFVVKAFDWKKETWQILGYVFAKNDFEAWEKAEKTYKNKNIQQVIEFDSWLIE